MDWDAKACNGIDLKYLKQNGYARLDVGTKDNRVPHKEGNFPTPSGKCQLILRGVNNFVAAPFRQMYEGYHRSNLCQLSQIMFHQESRHRTTRS